MSKFKFSCGVCDEENIPCGYQTKYFSDFVEHIREVEGFLFTYKGHGNKEFLIRVYSKFYCRKCRRGFTSSAAPCKVFRNDDGEFSIEKDYSMECRKCQKKAKRDTDLIHFINKAKYYTILDAYPEIKLNIETDDKRLDGHIEELCELCQELGYSCVGGNTSKKNSTYNRVYTPSRSHTYRKVYYNY
jgi:hypothetical protein